MKKSTKDWFDSAESDLNLINHIIEDETLTHLAAFHAQQAVEKTFKGLIEEFDRGPIKTHSLETLYNKITGILNPEPDIELLILLDQLYIDTRYPGAFGLLPDGKPSLMESENFFVFASEIVNSALEATRNQSR